MKNIGKIAGGVLLCGILVSTSYMAKKNVIDPITKTISNYINNPHYLIPNFYKLKR